MAKSSKVKKPEDCFASFQNFKFIACFQSLVSYINYLEIDVDVAYKDSKDSSYMDSSFKD